MKGSVTEEDSISMIVIGTLMRTKIEKMRVFNDMVAQIMENISQGGSINSSVSEINEGGHTFSKRVKYIIKWVPKVYVRLDINLISLE